MLRCVPDSKSDSSQLNIQQWAMAAITLHTSRLPHGASRHLTSFTLLTTSYLDKCDNYF